MEDGVEGRRRREEIDMRRIAALSGLFMAVAAVPVHASPSFIKIASLGDDPRGVSLAYSSDVSTFTTFVTDRSLSVRVVPQGNPTITIGFNPGTLLALGTTEADGAALEFTGLPGTCDNPTATVTLTALVTNLAAHASVLRLSFSQQCQGATGTMTGSVDIEEGAIEETIPGGAGGDSVVGEGTTYAFNRLLPHGRHVYSAATVVQAGVSHVVNPANTDAYPGGLDGGRLAYQVITYGKRAQSNIHVRDLNSMAELPLPGLNSSAWEWNPDISGGRVLYTRNNRKSTKWTAYLYDIKTHAQHVVTKGRYGKRAGWVDAIAGNYIVWDTCVKWRCSVTRYTISTGRKDVLRATRTRTFYEPAVTRQGTVYLGGSGRNCGSNAAVERWIPGSVPVTVMKMPVRQDIGGTDLDEFAGTTYLYFEHGICRKPAPRIFTSRLAVAYP